MSARLLLGLQDARSLVIALAAVLVLALGQARAQPAEVDGCSESMYLDRTAAGADRIFNWDYAFAMDPERCITVRVGQSVRWQGNFGDHPLDPDQGDTPNPIASHDDGLVTFTRTGTFGYRCNFHLAMRGAIRVLPAPAIVPWAGPYAQTTLLAILLILGFGVAREARRSNTLRALFAEHVTRGLGRWLEPVILLSCVMGLALSLGPARHGSPDSATYLSAAEHLARGDGYVISSLDDHGRFEPLACFAPLFSLLIALLMKLQHMDARAAMDAAVLLSFLLYALGCYALLKVLPPSPLRRWAMPLALCLTCLPGSVMCLRSALSDLLGAGLVLLACAHLLASSSALTRGAARRAGMLFALAVWARWANLYFALGACAGVLLSTRATRVRQRLGHALIMAGSLLVLVLPLWLRNLIAAGDAMGPRPLDLSDPLLHAQHALMGLAQPLIEAGRAYHGFSVLPELYVVMVLACSAGIVALWLGRRESTTDLGLALVLGYIVLLVASSSSTRLDSIDHPRFWLPVWPLLIGVALRTLCAAREPVLRAPLTVLGSWLVSLIMAHVVLDVAGQRAYVPSQSGVFARHLTSSQVVQRALDLFDGGRCLLSSPHAFWLFPQLGARPVQWPTEATSRALSTRQASCVLVLRERADFNTDGVRFHNYFERLAQSSRARLLQRDAHAELWWADPTAARRNAQHL